MNLTDAAIKARSKVKRTGRPTELVTYGKLMRSIKSCLCQLEVRKTGQILLRNDPVEKTAADLFNFSWIDRDQAIAAIEKAMEELL